MEAILSNESVSEKVPSVLYPLNDYYYYYYWVREDKGEASLVDELFQINERSKFATYR